MKPYLEELNEHQYRVATTLEGTVQVNATAGSGKTKTLVSRVAHMIDSGISPYSILLTTFTTKAAKEMKDRLAKIVPKIKVDAVTIGTTHSICYRILATELQNIFDPRASAFVKDNGILTEGIQKVIASKAKKKLLDDVHVDWEIRKLIKDIPEGALVGIISKAKNLGLTVEDYYQEKVVKGTGDENFYSMLSLYYGYYETLKSEEKKLDMDDLLLVTLELFNTHDKILAKYQSTYQYIMVDEAQDNNLITYKLIKMLAMPQNNLLLCGDEDQTLYSFRGSKPEEFIDFSKEYPDAQVIPLSKNYRSKPHILEVADNIIRNNNQRLNKDIIPHKEGLETCVTYSQFNKATEEAESIVDTICHHLEEGIPAHKIAVLYRTNALSQSVEEELIKAGIPYIIYGGINFYERKEIKDIMSYLKVLAYRDNDAVERVVNIPKRYLGKAFLNKIKNGSSDSLWDNMSELFNSMKKYEQNGVHDFRKTIRFMHDAYTSTRKVGDAIRALLGRGGYKDYIDEEESTEDNVRIDNINRLLAIAEEHPDISAFISYVESMETATKQSPKGIQLMSIHRSKGLEFPVCFVIGCTEGVFPHFKSMTAVAENTNPLAIEEERRLMFVAVTRAEDVCYLSGSKMYYSSGGDTSRFVKESGLIQNEEKEENPL